MTPLHSDDGSLDNPVLAIVNLQVRLLHEPGNRAFLGLDHDQVLVGEGTALYYARHAYQVALSEVHHGFQPPSCSPRAAYATNSLFGRRYFT